MSHTPPSSSKTDAASDPCPFAGGALHERESRSRLELALQASGEGFWGVAARAGQAVPLGHPRIAPRPAGRRTSFPGTEYLARIHPDDVAGVRDMLADLLRNDYRGETLEHRFPHPRRRWRFTAGHACAPSQRRPATAKCRVAGMHADISELKEADRPRGTSSTATGNSTKRPRWH